MKTSLSKQKINKAIAMAILAAALYGISSPVSKILLRELSPTFMASLLYLGAGIGMIILSIIKNKRNHTNLEANLKKKDLPYIVAMIILDIIAPILLMNGLRLTNAGNVSLLNNFEIVATSLIALLIFKEAVGKRMWLAIVLITVASIILAVDDFSVFSLSIGSLMVIGACICWGFENNCTRMLSLNNPSHIVIIKGFGSGIGALIIALLLNDINFNIKYIFIALLIGFVSYGLGIQLYIHAQRTLGASRTSAFYATAPFIGVITSWIIFRETVTISFFIAIFIMLVATYFAVYEKHSHNHAHSENLHEHRHNHKDQHHNHTHDDNPLEEHSHLHKHDELEHKHTHTPDMHHTHKH